MKGKTVLKYFVIIFISIEISGCFNNSFIYRPSEKEFENIFPKPYGSSYENLKTTSFYYNNTIISSDDEFFTYLSFKPNGTIIYLSNTSMSPDTLKGWSEIWNPELRKDGIPKDNSVDFGFYKTLGDSVFGLIHVNELMGLCDYYKIKGKIFENSINIDIEKTGIGSHTENWLFNDKKFIFKD